MGYGLRDFWWLMNSFCDRMEWKIAPVVAFLCSSIILIFLRLKQSIPFAARYTGQNALPTNIYECKLDDCSFLVLPTFSGKGHGKVNFLSLDKTQN